MLELLVTSHGSSESCGVKQGTGCSRGLRAITPQKAGSQEEAAQNQREETDRTNKEGKENGRDGLKSNETVVSVTTGLRKEN